MSTVFKTVYKINIVQMFIKMILLDLYSHLQIHILMKFTFTICIILYISIQKTKRVKTCF